MHRDSCIDAEMHEKWENTDGQGLVFEALSGNGIMTFGIIIANI